MAFLASLMFWYEPRMWILLWRKGEGGEGGGREEGRKDIQWNLVDVTLHHSLTPGNNIIDRSQRMYCANEHWLTEWR